MAWRAVLLVAILLAGCSDPPARPPPEGGTRVEGWVFDEGLRPVAAATVRGDGNETATDADGHYSLQVPSDQSSVITVAAPGFLPATQSLGASSGAFQVLNFTLRREPPPAPPPLVTSFNGVLQCGAVATTMEDPSRPHEHQGVRCSSLLNDTSNRWLYDLQPGTQGIVLEVEWDAQSPLSQAMVLKATNAGGVPFAFIEGTSVLRQQLSSVKLQQEQQAGGSLLVITLEPGAGTGNHEHGAAGLFLRQPFTIYATAFFAEVPPDYSLTDA